MISVTDITHQLKKIISAPLLSRNKERQPPLLNNDEILDLMLRVQSNKRTNRHKQDISHRQLGDVSSIYRGQGMDYEESRHYQSGDDPRYMNWQLTARSGQHFMKVFREERQPGAFILVDRRCSMRFGTQQRLKVTQAVRVAAITAFAAQQYNYSVAAIIVAEKQIWFKQSHNKQSVVDFIHHAAKPVAVATDNQKMNEPKLHDILRTLEAIVTKGTSIYLISDFQDLTEESQAVLFSLAASHQVHAIHIVDPAEIDLPEAGLLSLHSQTLQKIASINSNDKIDRENYKKTAKSNFSRIKDLFTSSRISYQQLLTTDSIEKINNL